MLTPRENRVWRFIAERLLSEGVAPTYRDIMDHMRWRSENTPFDVIGRLERKGYVRRIPARARALTVLRWPDEGPRYRYWLAVQPEGADMWLVEVGR